MPEPLQITTTARKSWAVDLDEPVSWGCSGKGWNCCVGVGIAVRPYDMLRLRHAAARPSQDLINDSTVTFEWERGSGILMGRLAHRAYEAGHRPDGQSEAACVFLDELTNLDVRRIREQDPARFAGLPPGVQRHAEGRTDREWKVAGLCRVHSGRPEVCRGFPYQRLPAHDGAATGSEVHQVSRCGSCAHATPTTPREILEGESVGEYWRADDAFRQVSRYLHALGAANAPDPAYRHLVADELQRTELWVSLYVPDTHPRLAARVLGLGLALAEQWRAPLDIEGDRALYRALLDETLEQVEALVERSGLAASDLGMPGDAIARPDLDALLDPTRELLPRQAVGPVEAAARRVT
ncbi:MAG: hypothetical protein O2895_01050 [Chloroflexi bacterium]|nr:hypothetical protein [Chloroflexota bacterium]